MLCASGPLRLGQVGVQERRLAPELMSVRRAFSGGPSGQTGQQITPRGHLDFCSPLCGLGPLQWQQKGLDLPNPWFLLGNILHVCLLWFRG